MAYNSLTTAPTSRLWQGVTNTRVLIVSGTISLIAGTLGGLGWVMMQRTLWKYRSATMVHSDWVRHGISALLLAAGVTVAASIFRMSGDTKRIGRTQAIVYWAATAVLWILVFVALATAVDVRACCGALPL